MSDFKTRLATEKSELDEKIDKLSNFMAGTAFTSIDDKQQELLNKQLPVMKEYSDILQERITLLTE